MILQNMNPASKYADTLITLQEKSSALLNDVERISSMQDAARLALIKPRISYLLSITTGLKDKMDLAAAGVSDLVTRQVITQQKASVDILEGQLKNLSQAINLALNASSISEKQKSCQNAVALSQKISRHLSEMKKMT